MLREFTQLAPRIAAMVWVCALGCVPQTMLRLQSETIQPAPHMATVVVMYPSLTGTFWTKWASMPLFQSDGKGVWFRIADRGCTVADLDANTYTILYLTPGKHLLTASSWAADGDDHTVAALDAKVSQGRVYVVSLDFRDGRFSLAPASPADATALLRRLPQYERLALDPNRTPHFILDSNMRAAMVDNDIAWLRKNGRVTTLVD